MPRFRVPLLTAVLLTATATLVRPASATDFFIFPVKVSAPVRMVEMGTDPDSIVEKKLTEKDVVNLALGRGLATKVDKKTEVLAVQIARFAEDADKARLIVFDPSQNGLAQIRTVVAKPLVLDREIALLSDEKKQGVGTATGRLEPTTLGTPAQNAILSGEGWASGAGSSKEDKGTFKGILAGRVNLRLTENGQTKDFAGYLVNAKVTVAGKPLGMFDDGETEAGCGDGIIQPGLGEECEFVNQTACPGNCDACRCVVCGDADVDPGEICDGDVKPICDDLGVTSYCKPDCSGCTFCGDSVVDPPEECDFRGGADTACPGQCSSTTCMCPG